jgi:hypothetical protein
VKASWLTQHACFFGDANDRAESTVADSFAGRLLARVHLSYRLRIGAACCRVSDDIPSSLPRAPLSGGGDAYRQVPSVSLQVEPAAECSTSWLAVLGRRRPLARPCRGCRRRLLEWWLFERRLVLPLVVIRGECWRARGRWRGGCRCCVGRRERRRCGFGGQQLGRHRATRRRRRGGVRRHAPGRAWQRSCGHGCSDRP